MALFFFILPMHFAFSLFQFFDNFFFGNILAKYIFIAIFMHSPRKKCDAVARKKNN
jgi:hypothetical protein